MSSWRCRDDMKQILYEFKKTVFRKQMCFLLIIMCCINIFYFNYHLRSINLYQLSNPLYKETFYKLHHEYDGTLTQEKAAKINAEYQKTNTMISSGAYNRNHTEDSLTGYYFQDYQLLKVYFHDPMMKMALYGDKMDSIVNQAKENKSIVKPSSYTYSYNNYIEKHYKNRSLSSFYNFIGWQYLFDYQLSDILIILLLACFLLPTYIKEKKSMMNEIMDTTNLGKKNCFKTKILCNLMLVATLVIIFACMNIMMTNMTIGIAGSSSPIYSLSEFSSTPYACSIMGFYLLCLISKIIGFSIIGCLFLLITKFVKEYLSAFVLAIVLIAILLFFNGYIDAFSMKLRILSLLSPFHLINFPAIAQSIKGFNVLGHYVNNDIMVVIMQLLMFIVFTAVIVKRKKGRHHVKMGIKKNII